VRTRRKVLLMGAGIGITPLKAMLEELPQHPGDVTVIQRGSSRHGLVLADEIRDLAAARAARHIVVEGHRIAGRRTWLPAQASHLTDAQALWELVPDIADHDVFLCGAPDWMDAAREAALECGVPAEHVHTERFAY
jgi:ferredoxin-NADP reductase